MDSKAFFEVFPTLDIKQKYKDYLEDTFVTRVSSVKGKNIMRQWIAVSIVFWGTKYLKDNRYIPFIISVVIATLFHTSAVIGLGYLIVSIFFNKKIIKSKKLVSIIIMELSRNVQS